MDKYLKPNILVLIGAWPLPNHRITELIKRFNSMMINVMFIIGIIFFTYDIIYNFSDTFSLCKGVTGSLALLQNLHKNLSFMFRRELFRDILTIIDDLHENTPLPNTDAKIVEKRKKYQNRTHLWIKVIISPFTSTLMIVFIYPWCLYLLKNKVQLLITMTYNDTEVSFGKFILLYVVDVIIICSCNILIQIASEVVFISYILCVCSCVDVLQYCMQIATEEKQVTPLFGKCIDYHNKILMLVKYIEKLFSPLLLTQFIISTISICVVTFLIIQTQVDSGLQAILMSYLVGINMEMFVFCYFGQLMNTKFEQFYMAGFHFPWYEASLAYQKNMLIFLSCCSRPVILTAGKMALVNLEYYFSLCKLSISYYTLLRRVVEDK